MTTMTTYVFVYGTLRPGGRLARYWAGMAEPYMDDGAWRLPDYRLVGGGFPFALPSPDRQNVTGAILRVLDGHEEALLAVLDSVEGVDGGLYERVLGDVYLAHNPEFQVSAWFYRPPRPETREHLPKVYQNDWVAHEAAEEARHMADSDWCECRAGPTYAGTVRCAECWGRIRTGVPADL